MVARSQDFASTSRVPPQSIEAEQSVLGGLLIDNSRWDLISDVITTEDFYDRDNARIFETIKMLLELDQPADLVTVSDKMTGSGESNGRSNLSYVSELAQNTPTAANITHYAEIVRDRAQARRLIAACHDIVDVALSQESVVGETVDYAEKRVMEVSLEREKATRGFRPMNEYITEGLDRIDELYKSDSPITGIPTGFTDLDAMTSGIQNSDLVIIAGRPSMGKTSFVMNLVEYAAIKTKVPIAVFSLEMPGQQLATRMMSSLGNIDAGRIRSGKLHDDDWPRLTHAIKILNEAPIFIDDSSGLSPLDIRSRSRRLHREGKLGMIVIDYLQLMSSSERAENRVTEVSQMTRSLKNLARELDVPILLLSQLSRKPEERTDKRPVMSDLRESGAIEQDADLIMFVYRDEHYNKETAEKGVAEIIIGKHRNGPTGTVRLAFQGMYTRFQNFSPMDFDGGL